MKFYTQALDTSGSVILHRDSVPLRLRWLPDGRLTVKGAGGGA